MIVAVLLLGVLAAATPRRGPEETATSTPDAGVIRPRLPDVRTAREVPAPTVAATVPAPTTTVVAEEPEPPPVAPVSEPPPPPTAPVVNKPPPGPNRVAPPASTPPPPNGQSTAVYPDEFPDPFVIRAHGFYWAFSTQLGWDTVPTLRSSDLLHWEWVGNALAELPPWAEWGHNWAPSVLQRGSTFVMYYTTRHAATGLQCISRATSVLPQGPYLDDSEAPLICQTARGGSIDPSPFVDGSGKPWLLWKSEGTLQGEPTRIWVQQLGPDGQHLVGSATQLLERSEEWEFPIIEGPAMALVDGRYHLFYSANRWETARYSVGHAVCASVTGPCRRTSAGPVLATRAGEAGPGGQELIASPTGELVLVHHAWAPDAVGYPAGGTRRLHVTSLRFDGDRVEVGGPWGDRGDGGLLGVHPGSGA